MPTITLDVISGVSVDSDDYFNECQTLHMLSAGLFRIASNLKQRELAWEQQTGGKARFQVFGLDIDGTKGDLDLIACFFHWFGVSICNYARLVGFVRGLSVGEFTRADLRDATTFHDVRSSVDAYVESVLDLTSVVVWRNKVGAHFAITAPHKSDNRATLDMSVMFPVTFSMGRYRVGESTLSQKCGAENHTSAIPCWSVTDVFDRLLPRYWPQLVVTPTSTEEAN